MDREPRDRQYISPTRVDRGIKREDITMQVEFVSKLMADNIDQEALNQILSEKIKELTQSNARLSIELSIINRMIDGEELDPIDMEYYGTLHEKVAKLLSR